MPAKLRCRSLFISDTHLGSRGARAEALARFLKRVRCERLYLVGDIIDMWRLKSRWYWPAEHNDVIRRILKHVKRGTAVYFLPGNHDEAARQFLNLRFGGVKVVPWIEHVAPTGRKLLVIHGDQFDLVVTHSKVISMLGAAGYEALLYLNRGYNAWRRWTGRPYFSLSQYIKLKVKKACMFISRFEDALLDEAKRRKLDGVICGHVHHAENREQDGLTYINCGDWVENCTAVVEYHDGRLEVVSGLKVLEELEAIDAADAATSATLDVEPGVPSPTHWLQMRRRSERPAKRQPAEPPVGHDVEV